jgi:hypothetical protein
MKKLLLSVAAASLMLVACKKEEAAGITSSNPVGTAIIKGKAQANTDETNFDPTWGWDIYENVPDGTPVILTFEIDGQTYRYTSSVTNGEYSFEIPSRNEGMMVEIDFSDFRSNVKFGPNAEDVYPDAVFEAGDESVWAHAGEVVINDVMYYYNI